MPSPRLPRLSAALVLALLTSAPAAADWLVTLDGALIETRGAWRVEGDVVTYTDLDGEVRTVARSELDLEGSAETTALRTGKPAPVVPPPPPAPEPAARDAPEPWRKSEIVLYTTRWCGYCRKARRLLDDLDVDYVEKDIEKDREAAWELAEKVGGRSGVPVLDVDGELIRGYDARKIRRKVREYRERDSE